MQRQLNLMVWIAAMLIISIGLVALYSASYQNVRVPHQVFYSQLLGACFGAILMLYLSRMDFRRFYDAAYVLYGIAVVLLILVHVAGRNALGATRWFEIAGISFQPSEIAKLAVIMALARYFSGRRPHARVSWEGVWADLLQPLLIALVPMALIFKQPDLGSAILIFGIFFVILFASGISARVLAAFMALGLAVLPFGWHVLKDYQKDRLLVFMNPNIDPLGAGYTIIQSKIAVGSGQLFGKGWLSGTQNQLNFLPERHTDFIFSVIGEEWGLCGTLFLLGCYFVLIHAGLVVAERAKDRFGSLAVTGIVGILSIQVVVNMGMVLGLCPVVGITLPLISFGRSSFLIFILMIGFVLGVNRRRTVF